MDSQNHLQMHMVLTLMSSPLPQLSAACYMLYDCIVFLLKDIYFDLAACMHIYFVLAACMRISLWSSFWRLWTLGSTRPGSSFSLSTRSLHTADMHIMWSHLI